MSLNKFKTHDNLLKQKKKLLSKTSALHKKINSVNWKFGQNTVAVIKILTGKSIN